LTFSDVILRWCEKYDAALAFRRAFAVDNNVSNVIRSRGPAVDVDLYFTTGRACFTTSLPSLSNFHSTSMANVGSFCAL
jgi:hypothetical protein